MKDRTQREYYQKSNSPLLIDYVKLEMEKRVLSSTTLVPGQINTAAHDSTTYLFYLFFITVSQLENCCSHVEL